MGAFYTNITLKGPEQAEVVAALRGRKAFVSPQEYNCVVVFDEMTEEQDPAVLASVTASLSHQLGCPALAMLNHDDDMLVYQLYDRGILQDEYNSMPDYFDDVPECARGGDAMKLIEVFGAGDLGTLERILVSDEYTFATERHQALASALGLPLCAVGFGYNYLIDGDLPPGIATC